MWIAHASRKQFFAHCWNQVWARCWLFSSSCTHRYSCCSCSIGCMARLITRYHGFNCRFLFHWLSEKGFIIFESSQGENSVVYPSKTKTSSLSHGGWMGFAFRSLSSWDVPIKQAWSGRAVGFTQKGGAMSAIRIEKIKKNIGSKGWCSGKTSSKQSIIILAIEDPQFLKCVFWKFWKTKWASGLLPHFDWPAEGEVQDYKAIWKVSSFHNPLKILIADILHHFISIFPKIILQWFVGTSDFHYFRSVFKASFKGVGFEHQGLMALHHHLDFHHHQAGK